LKEVVLKTVEEAGEFGFSGRCARESSLAARRNGCRPGLAMT
jgi:hypothetical protein